MWNKGTLNRVNEFSKKGSHSVSQNFGYDLIKCVAQTDGPELRCDRGVINFRNESDKIVVNLR